MNASINKFLTYCCVGILGIASIKGNLLQNNTAVAQSTPQQSVPSPIPETPVLENPSSYQRILKLSVTVDHPSFLKVRLGDALKENQVIADNTNERNRLLRQRESVQLQINNLKSQPILKPTPPTAPPLIAPIPGANYAEEEAAIASAQMKLAQAQSVLVARTPLLKTDNPERRAEAENAEASVQLKSQKVLAQQQLMSAMKDQNMTAPVIEHEQALLVRLEGELELAKSSLEQARGKLSASGIDQQQQLQQLELGVAFALSDLELAKSRLLAAQSRRELIEYNASVNTVERSQRMSQLQQEYTRSSQIYDSSVRERDYQMAQLSLSLSNVDEKIGLIPVVLSPKKRLHQKN